MVAVSDPDLLRLPCHIMSIECSLLNYDSIENAVHKCMLVCLVKVTAAASQQIVQDMKRRHRELLKRTKLLTNKSRHSREICIMTRGQLHWSSLCALPIIKVQM